MPNQPFLSVVVPSYNEGRNLKRHVLDDVMAFLNKQRYSFELVLTDDGSTDDTVEELKKFARNHDFVRLVLNKHQGKGPTVCAGMLAAKGEWRLFTDFDQSTPIAEVNKLLNFVGSKDVIIGSREIVGARRDKEPFYRHLMGRGFNLLVQFLAVPGIKDTQCGFKLFSGKATEYLFSKLFVYSPGKVRRDAFTGAFDVELLFIARKNGFRIAEVPIIWRHHFTDRVSPIKDSIRMLIDIIKIRFAYLLGKY